MTLELHCYVLVTFFHFFCFDGFPWRLAIVVLKELWPSQPDVEAQAEAEEHDGKNKAEKGTQCWVHPCGYHQNVGHAGKNTSHSLTRENATDVLGRELSSNANQTTCIKQDL